MADETRDPYSVYGCITFIMLRCDVIFGERVGPLSHRSRLGYVQGVTLTSRERRLFVVFSHSSPIVVEDDDLFCSSGRQQAQYNVCSVVDIYTLRSNGTYSENTTVVHL